MFDGNKQNKKIRSKIFVYGLELKFKFSEVEDFKLTCRLKKKNYRKENGPAAIWTKWFSCKKQVKLMILLRNWNKNFAIAIEKLARTVIAAQTVGLRQKSTPKTFIAALALNCANWALTAANKVSAHNKGEKEDCASQLHSRTDNSAKKSSEKETAQNNHNKNVDNKLEKQLQSQPSYHRCVAHNDNADATQRSTSAWCIARCTHMDVSIYNPIFEFYHPNCLRHAHDLKIVAYLGRHVFLF